MSLFSPLLSLFRTSTGQAGAASYYALSPALDPLRLG